MHILLLRLFLQSVPGVINLHILQAVDTPSRSLRPDEGREEIHDDRLLFCEEEDGRL